MKLEEISAIAKAREVSQGKLSKTEIIQAIQTAEGNFDCYGTAHEGECDRVDCCWREDCFDAAQLGELS